MLSRIFAYYFCLLISTSAWAQVKFQTVYGGLQNDEGRSVQQTTDHGYIVAGTTSSFGINESPDIYLVKTDSLGQKQWQRNYGGTGIEKGFSVRQTLDEGYILFGHTNSRGKGGYDLYLVKTNSSGDTLWTRTYGGEDWDFGYSIVPTRDGGYVMTGATYSFGNGDADVYLIKVNSQGDTLWTKTIGGIGEDVGQSVWEGSDGNLFITGYTTSFGKGGYDIYYLLIKPDGETLWTKTLGGSKDDQAYQGRGVADGGFIMAGYTGDGYAGSNDIYLIKTKADGDTLWTVKTGAINGNNGGDDKGFAVDTAFNGGYIIAGSSINSSFHETYFYWTDPYGNWYRSTTKTDLIFSSADAYDIALTSDSGFVMVGTVKNTKKGLQDVYLVKFNSSMASANVVTSVEKEISSTEQWEIFPHPVSDVSAIQFKKRIDSGALIIYDLLGNELKTIPIDHHERVLISKNELATGMYLFKVLNENKVVTTGKFIVSGMQ